MPGEGPGQPGAGPHGLALKSEAERWALWGGRGQISHLKVYQCFLSDDFSEQLGKMCKEIHGITFPVN